MLANCNLLRETQLPIAALLDGFLFRGFSNCGSTVRVMEIPQREGEPERKKDCAVAKPVMVDGADKPQGVSFT